METPIKKPLTEGRYSGRSQSSQGTKWTLTEIDLIKYSQKKLTKRGIHSRIDGGN